MATQTVNFIPPDAINALTSTIFTLSTGATSQVVTTSFTAESNFTYEYNLPTKQTGAAVTITCTLPLSPSNGQTIRLFDNSNPLNGWGNTFYSCKVSGNGREIKGDCAALSGQVGDLFLYRGMTMIFVYLASSNVWVGQSQGNPMIKSSDPFTGWWERMNRSSVTGIRGRYFYLDATRYPITADYYDGMNKEFFMKTASTSQGTYYELTGASPSNPYQRTLASIVGSRVFGGPETTYSVTSNANFFGFPSSSFDYLINYTGYIPKGTIATTPGLVGVFRRVTQTPSNNRVIANDFHQIDTQGGEFINQSFSDPVFMFRKIMSEFEQTSYLNSNITNNLAPDYYTRHQFYDDLQSPAGVTFSCPVALVRKSHVFSGIGLVDSLTGNNTPSYTGGSTRLTDICCHFTHYVGPGANITLSGFENSWTGLNGYYPNGVSCHAWQINKENSRRMDYFYSGPATASSRIITGSSTGSALQWANRFMLLKDTSDPSYLAETTGAWRGYGINIGSNPNVSVNYRLYKAMPPNEFIGLFFAACKYLYPYCIHQRPNAQMADVFGRMPTEWSALSSTATFASRLRAKGGEFAPCTPILNSFYQRLDQKANGQAYSLNALGGAINDPYQVTDFIRNRILLNMPVTNSALSRILAIPFINYCETGTLKNMYLAYTGTAPVTLTQQAYATARNLRNSSNTGVIGGTQIVARLFDFVNPFTTGAYAPYFIGNARPDPTVWRLSGDGTEKFVIGKLRSDLCGGKTIIYIRISEQFSWHDADYDLNGNGMGGQFKDFAPPGFTGPASLTSNPFFGIYAAQLGYFAEVAKYINSFTGSTGAAGPDAIIIDTRTSSGGSFPYAFLHMFGSDRAWQTTNGFWQDDGYSSKLFPVVGTGTNGYWTPSPASGRTYPSLDDSGFFGTEYTKLIRPSLMEQNFGPNSIIKNCNIVVMATECNESMAEQIPTLFYGANGDRNLGNGVRVNIIGDRTPGFGGGSFPAFNVTIPPVSRRFPLTTFLNYSVDAVFSPVFNSETGPLAGRLPIEDILTWSANNAPTGPNALVPIAPVEALPNNHSITYYDLGFLAPPSGSYYIAQSRPTPSTTDTNSWRDSWLEQGIRQAIYM